jgi:tight adherence protein C
MSAAAVLAAVAGISGAVGAWEWGSPVLRRLDRALAKIRAARFGSPDWLVLKVTSALVASAVTLVLGSAAPGRLPFLLMVAAPIAGFVAPDQWLKRVTRRRLEAAVRELPDMLDLFRVTVEAGMPAARALGVVASEFDGPLAREWRRAAGEIALGESQEDVLAALALRLPADEISSFVEALGRSRRRGVPIGRAAAAQATAARHRRRRQVREHAARAGPKIQLVVALLLVPSVLLLVAAGLVAELERSPLPGFPA